MNKPLTLLTSLLFLSRLPDDADGDAMGMSDYHSHAVPFYSEGEPGQGGVARALAYLQGGEGRGRTRWWCREGTR